MKDVIRDAGRVSGVVAEVDGEARTIRASMVVGADGRRSPVAEAAGFKTRTRRHERFGYIATFAGLRRDAENRSSMWFAEPDMAYQFPNDDGLTVLALMKPMPELDAFRADPDAAFRAAFAALPDGPDLSAGEQIGRLQPMISYPNQLRSAGRPGVALVGDAAASADYLWGTGCGWALQSGEWLADETAAALAGGDPTAVDAAIDRYRRLHRRRVTAHWFMCADYARVRGFNPLERLFYREAVRDAAIAKHLARFGERTIGVHDLVAPAALARAARASLRQLPA